MAPDFFDWHQQARVVGRLQHVLEAPRSLLLFRRRLRRRIEPKTEAERLVSTLVCVEIGPVADLPPQRLGAIALEVDDRVLAGQRADPRTDRRRQLRQVARLRPSSPCHPINGGRQIVRHGVPRRRALAVRLPGQRDGRWGHRAFDRPQRGAIARIVDDRQPATQQVVFARLHARHAPLSNQQRERKARRDDPCPQVGTQHAWVGGRGGRDARQQADGRHFVEHDRRHVPQTEPQILRDFDGLGRAVRRAVRRLRIRQRRQASKHMAHIGLGRPTREAHDR